MADERFRRHLARLGPRLDRLAAEGHGEPNVLALLAVESFYRPRAARLGEYALWAATSLLRPRALPTLSPGLAQVQLRHWAAGGELSGLRITPSRLARVRDPAANYRVCRRFLADRGALHLADPVRLTRLYTGWDRPGYARRLGLARARLAVRTDPDMMSVRGEPW